MKEVKSGYVEEVNITRGMAIFLAVLGHAFLSNDTGIQRYLFNFIYGFHMPLFFFISGYCNSGILHKNTWHEIGRSVFQRFCRLMIPYFTFGVIYVFLDVIGGKYSWKEFSVPVYLRDLIKGDNANWQLWTLYALFACFSLTALLKKWLSVPVMLAAAGACFVGMHILQTIPGLPSWPFYTIISSTAMQWLFFLGGMQVREKRDLFRQKPVRKAWLVLGFAVLIGCCILRTKLDLPLFALLTAPLGVWLFSELSKYVMLCKGPKKLFSIFGTYCMEIYIFANICQVLVRTVLFERLGAPEPVCIFLSLAAGLFVPILAGKYIVNKIGIFRILFLGKLKNGGETVADSQRI